MAIPDTYVGGLMGEIKHHPWTTVSAFIALSLSSYLYFTKADSDAIQRTLKELQSAVAQNGANDERRSLADRLDSTDRELFAITVKVNDLQAMHIPVDAIILQRQSQLNGLRNELSQKLASAGGRP